MLLQGEDEVRQSGVPYAIVRPCALTEEPAGADLVISQGDTIKVPSGVVAHCITCKHTCSVYALLLELRAAVLVAGSRHDR